MKPDPRTIETDKALDRALDDMIRRRNLKPDLQRRLDDGKNIYTRTLLADQAGVWRGTLSLEQDRHVDRLSRLHGAKKAFQNSRPDRIIELEKGINWRRRAQAATSVAAILMHELWALKASLPPAADVTSEEEIPDRLKGRRGPRRGQRQHSSQGG